MWLIRATADDAAVPFLSDLHTQSSPPANRREVATNNWIRAPHVLLRPYMGSTTCDRASSASNTVLSSVLFVASQNARDHDNEFLGIVSGDE